MISQSEAATFLDKILGFQNWKELLEKDKLEFLRVLVPHYAHHLAFQNISMSSVPPEQRQVPKEADIISAGLSGIGGPCITQNTFFCILLKALGFNSYLVSGFVHAPGNHPDNHVICIVEFSPEKKYLFDVGVALPFAEPVPMHDLPYTQTSAGFRYQYRKAKNGDGLYERIQLDGAFFAGSYDDKSTEKIRYDFSMTPRTVEFFQEPLQHIFKDVDDSIFLRQPFMFRYFEEDESGNILEQVNINGNRKWILIFGVSVVIATDTTRNVTHYSNYDEMKDVILKYFPKFREDDVKKSIQYFNETVPKYGYFKAN